MKLSLKVSTLLLTLMFLSSPSFGAFPVKPQPTKTKSEQVQESKTEVPTPKPAPASGEKSQLTALLLCIFLGGLGVHRFYLNYPGIGVIQLLTGGGLGIWWLIDLVKIITGDLKPKDGEYDTTL
ncbi:MAG: TM2 domain-containing membrane protein YozV [Bacteroidia bacterium]|jgi:TM2 domain-containing membrane protein YozV